VTRILHDVARAVEYAHEQGVVHRDLKPQNILLERDSGRAYVADFGLARVVDDGLLPGGGGGRTLGTVPYASPEQAAGLPADHRSDIYSLGIVGYVMATGRPLFTGLPWEVLEQHISRPAPPLRVLGRHLDTTLARAVGRCLVKDPRERFQSAGELARDLPPPLRDFVARLKLESRSAAGGIVLGAAGLWVLGGALEAGHWGTAAGALGFLGLLAASPVVGALPATRRLLRQGYAQVDIVHALNMDLDRQREQLAARWGRVTDATATWVRRVTLFAASLFGLGTLAALLGAGLPAGLVFGGMIIGAFGTVLGGSILVWRERRRNELTGHRWLRFWRSRLGDWTAKLAGIGLGARLGALPLEPVAAEPEAARLPAAEGYGAAPDPLHDLGDLVGRTESCISGIRARLAARPATGEPDGRALEDLESERTLERQLAVLEALLDRLREGDPITGVPGSLTADLEAAREICDVVEGLIEGTEWRV